MEEKTKTVTINFRVSLEEKDQMLRYARESGLAFSTYIRIQALKGNLEIKDSEIAEPEAVSKYDKYNIYLNANILMLLHAISQHLQIGDKIDSAEDKALRWLIDKKLINLAEPEGKKGE